MFLTFVFVNNFAILPVFFYILVMSITCMSFIVPSLLGHCLLMSKTSCAHGDTICPRHSPPLWAPKSSPAAETCGVGEPISVPISVFLGLSVLELHPMYATDRRQTKASLNVPTHWGRGHNN